MDRPLVLVSGCAGHLGTALMLSLPAQGFTPVGIDILTSPTTTHIVDITSKPQVASLFAIYRFTHIIHAATLHKPHVASHPKSAFLDVNLTGTLNLLEAAAAQVPRQPASFIFISTTSAFGSALSPPPGQPAAWIDEAVVPIPKNIYGTTKVAAEDLCRLVHRETGLPTLVLRTSRFFPEPDDDEDRRAAMDDDNLKVCELAYRRVDIADVVSACVCAMARAADIRFGKYIISAPPPVRRTDETLKGLDADAGEVIARAVPQARRVFEDRGWKFLARIDRIYDSSKAVRELSWSPEYTFEKAVEKIERGEEWRSDLTFLVGRKGYHAVSTGVYTVREAE
ncbi:hypothetical protein QBC47DRAFT_374774 [Echria macrotheca]|uniref:NAD-dependent epimerase/dehydratase domain-containing protein n=1 Tax=Echria macrotheca TaxID=438768 RepID=A0AAJ0BI92_9PEZI|nr:hypothetical protein QBC47DRAFT_374774 [Echria macrotheca]